MLSIHIVCTLRKRRMSDDDDEEEEEEEEEVNDCSYMHECM